MADDIAIQLTNQTRVGLLSFLTSTKQDHSASFGKSFLSVFLSALLVINPISAFASSQTTLPPSNSIEIPYAFGDLIQSKEADPHRWVYFVEDAHADQSAQKNIQNIISALQKTEPLDLVALEGGSQEIKLFTLKSFPFQEVIQSTVDELVQEAVLTGGEASFFLNDQTTRYFGIEDPKLYHSNLDAYYQVQSLREPAQKVIEALRKKLDGSRQDLWNKELIELHSREQVFYQGGMQGHQDFIQDLWAQLKPDERSKHPFLGKLQKRLQIEAQFNDPKSPESHALKQLFVELEEDRTLNKHSSEWKVLQAEKQALATGGNQSWACLRAIQELLNAQSAQTYYFDTYQQIPWDVLSDDLLNQSPEWSHLFEELSSASKAVKSRLCETDEARHLLMMDEALSLMEKTINLRLTRKEMQALDHQAGLSLFNHFQADGTKVDLDLLKRSLSASDIFYDLVQKRDHALFAEFKKYEKELRADRSVIIAGGFHTEGLVKQAEAQGYSYAVIRPRADGKGQTLYEERMEGLSQDYPNPQDLPFSLSPSEMNYLKGAWRQSLIDNLFGKGDPSLLSQESIRLDRILSEVIALQTLSSPLETLNDPNPLTQRMLHLYVESFRRLPVAQGLRTSAMSLGDATTDAPGLNINRYEAEDRLSGDKTNIFWEKKLKTKWLSFDLRDISKRLSQLLVKSKSTDDSHEHQHSYVLPTSMEIMNLYDPSPESRIMLKERKKLDMELGDLALTDSFRYRIEVAGQNAGFIDLTKSVKLPRGLGREEQKLGEWLTIYRIHISPEFRQQGIAFSIQNAIATFADIQGIGFGLHHVYNPVIQRQAPRLFQWDEAVFGGEIEAHRTLAAGHFELFTENDMKNVKNFQLRTVYQDYGLFLTQASGETEDHAFSLLPNGLVQVQDQFPSDVTVGFDQGRFEIETPAGMYADVRLESKKAIFLYGHPSPIQLSVRNDQLDWMQETPSGHKLIREIPLQASSLGDESPQREKFFSLQTVLQAGRSFRNLFRKSPALILAEQNETPLNNLEIINQDYVPKPIESVLFDFHGTLVDSAELQRKTFSKLYHWIINGETDELSDEQIEEGMDFLDDTMGMLIREQVTMLIAKVYGDQRKTESDLKAIQARLVDQLKEKELNVDIQGLSTEDSFIRIFEIVLRSEIDKNPPLLKEGVTELLDHLKEKGIRMFVGSGTVKGAVEEVLTHWGVMDNFDAVYGAVVADREAPDTKEEMVARGNIDLVIGDGFVDMTAKKGKEGAVAVGIHHGQKQNRSSLIEGGADVLIPSLKDWKKYLGLIGLPAIIPKEAMDRAYQKSWDQAKKQKQEWPKMDAVLKELEKSGVKASMKDLVEYFGRHEGYQAYDAEGQLAGKAVSESHQPKIIKGQSAMTNLVTMGEAIQVGVQERIPDLPIVHPEDGEEETEEKVALETARFLMTTNQAWIEKDPSVILPEPQKVVTAYEEMMINILIEDLAGINAKAKLNPTDWSHLVAETLKGPALKTSDLIDELTVKLEVSSEVLSEIVQEILDLGLIYWKVGIDGGQRESFLTNDGWKESREEVQGFLTKEFAGALTENYSWNETSMQLLKTWLYAEDSSLQENAQKLLSEIGLGRKQLSELKTMILKAELEAWKVWVGDHLREWETLEGEALWKAAEVYRGKLIDQVKTAIETQHHSSAYSAQVFADQLRLGTQISAFRDPPPLVRFIKDHFKNQIADHLENKIIAPLRRPVLKEEDSPAAVAHRERINIVAAIFETLFEFPWGLEQTSQQGIRVERELTNAYSMLLTDSNMVNKPIAEITVEKIQDPEMTVSKHATIDQMIDKVRAQRTQMESMYELNPNEMFRGLIEKLTEIEIYLDKSVRERVEGGYYLFQSTDIFDLRERKKKEAIVSLDKAFEIAIQGMTLEKLWAEVPSGIAPGTWFHFVNQSLSPEVSMQEIAKEYFLELDTDRQIRVENEYEKLLSRKAAVEDELRAKYESLRSLIEAKILKEARNPERLLAEYLGQLYLKDGRVPLDIYDLAMRVYFELNWNEDQPARAPPVVLFVEPNHGIVTFQEWGKWRRAHRGMTGIVDRKGGFSSHYVIDASHHKILAIFGVQEDGDQILETVPSGSFVILDGTTGEVHVNPDLETRIRLYDLRDRLALMRQYEASQALQAIQGKEKVIDRLIVFNKRIQNRLLVAVVKSFQKSVVYALNTLGLSIERVRNIPRPNWIKEIRHISLADIADLDELSATSRNESRSNAQLAGAEGVGLFRLENVLLADDRQGIQKNEDRMTSVLQKILDSALLASLGEHPFDQRINVRLFDVQEDKIPDVLKEIYPDDENKKRRLEIVQKYPGFSFYLQHKEFWAFGVRQVKALLRANLATKNRGALNILFPMINNMDDASKAREMIAQALSELGQPEAMEGVKIGWMLETVEAQTNAVVLMESADFVSNGTNDANQSLLKEQAQNENPDISEADLLEVSRHNPIYGVEFRELRPALTQWLWRVAQASLSTETPCAVCGELGGSVRMAFFLQAIRQKYAADISPVSALNAMPHQREYLRQADAQRLEQIFAPLFEVIDDWTWIPNAKIQELLGMIQEMQKQESLDESDEGVISLKRNLETIAAEKGLSFDEFSWNSLKTNILGKQEIEADQVQLVFDPVLRVLEASKHYEAEIAEKIEASDEYQEFLREMKDQASSLGSEQKALARSLTEADFSALSLGEQLDYFERRLLGLDATNDPDPGRDDESEWRLLLEAIERGANAEITVSDYREAIIQMTQKFSGLEIWDRSTQDDPAKKVLVLPLEWLPKDMQTQEWMSILRSLGAGGELILPVQNGLEDEGLFNTLRVTIENQSDLPRIRRISYVGDFPIAEINRSLNKLGRVRGLWVLPESENQEGILADVSREDIEMMASFARLPRDLSLLALNLVQSISEAGLLRQNLPDFLIWRSSLSGKRYLALEPAQFIHYLNDQILAVRALSQAA